MVKIVGLVIVLLAIGGMVGIAIPAYSQEEVKEQTTTSVSGEVVSIDLVKSTVGIRQLEDPATNTYKEVSISVLPETELIKGDVAIELSELKIGYKVTVESISNPAGESKIVSITVETEEAVPVE